MVCNLLNQKTYWTLPNFIGRNLGGHSLRQFFIFVRILSNSTGSEPKKA